MKKIIIGALVGAVIFFAYTSAMWMGGFHNDFSKYTPNQDAIMQNLNTNISEDGVYMIPGIDYNAPDAEKQAEKMMTESVGKPWAMISYHKEWKGMDPAQMVKGFLYYLLACFLVSLVIFRGNFNTFGSRFGVAMCFSLYGIVQFTLMEMNWWDYPWHFLKSTVFDMIIGWALVSLWLAKYVKPNPKTV
jgi:hypothetical protein